MPFAIRTLKFFRRPATISLEEAQPEIACFDQYTACGPAPAPGSYTVRRIYGSNITLIPLAVAQARDDIKYRMEGDEMRDIKMGKVRGVACV